MAHAQGGCFGGRNRRGGRRDARPAPHNRGGAGRIADRPRDPGLHDSANFFAGSFTGLLRFDGHPDRAISVNWGIAAIVYLLVGAILARAIFIAGRGGVHFGERHRTSVANY